MFMKKYLLFAIIPLLLSGEAIAGEVENIKYNSMYKSEAVDTYTVSTTSLLATYFYIFFTDKDKYTSLATTQSDISSIDELKNILKKETEIDKLPPLEQLKLVPSSSDKSAIRILSRTNGTFRSNKNGIMGVFNTYYKESDISFSNGGVQWKPPRTCNQITFTKNDTLMCDNGIEYTLLNKSSKK